MKIAVERNLIYAYTPMDIHNPHRDKFPLPYNDGQTTVAGEYWGAEEQMLFDVLGDVLRRSAYQNAKPQKVQLKRFISQIDKDGVDTRFTENDASKCKPIEFPLRLYAAKYHFPFLLKYTRKAFHQLMERASKIRVRCNYKYKINHFDKNREVITKFDFSPREPQGLFTYQYDAKDDRYTILFNTGMGRLFANNILAAEWEWLPFEFYNLSKNAQNLYRKFLLVRKKGTNIRLFDYKLAQVLKLQTTNRTVRNKSIRRLLEELVQKKYLEWRIEKGYKDPLYSITKSVSN